MGQRIRANLTALNMERFGAPVMAELGEPAYGGTHILLTDLEPQGRYIEIRPHQSTSRDDRTPLGPDGAPALCAAWRCLLGDGGRHAACRIRVTLGTPAHRSRGQVGDEQREHRGSC